MQHLFCYMMISCSSVSLYRNEKKEEYIKQKKAEKIREKRKQEIQQAKKEEKNKRAIEEYEKWLVYFFLFTLSKLERLMH